MHVVRHYGRRNIYDTLQPCWHSEKDQSLATTHGRHAPHVTGNNTDESLLPMSLMRLPMRLESLQLWVSMRQNSQLRAIKPPPSQRYTMQTKTRSCSVRQDERRFDHFGECASPVCISAWSPPWALRRTTYLDEQTIVEHPPPTAHVRRCPSTTLLLENGSCVTSSSNMERQGRGVWR